MREIGPDIVCVMVIQREILQTIQYLDVDVFENGAWLSVPQTSNLNWEDHDSSVDFGGAPFSFHDVRITKDRPYIHPIYLRPCK